MESVVWSSVFILMLGISFTSSQPYFTETPPLFYQNRKTTEDCPARFYADKHKYDVSFIHGGERAFRGEFQHMGAIGWTGADGEIQYLCGGTLISSKFLLTAAHCSVNGAGKVPDTVRLGDTDLSSTKDHKFAQQIKILRFIKHPQYRHSRKYFDIALVELESAVKFNEAICPACLWLEKDVPSEQWMEAVGFGATGYMDNLSPTLQKAKLSAISKANCLEGLSFSRRTLPRGFVEEQFCAGSDAMDTCEGDSGGPLQIHRIDVNRQLVPLIVGVVSFGTPCSDGSIGVYTRVASYQEWIESEIQKLMDYQTCTSLSGCFNRKRVKTNIENAPDNPFHRVGLLWNETDRHSFHCGATIIDYRYAITSAFCAQTKQGRPKFIIVEDTDETVEIDSIFVHPQYSPEHPENDIALLKLSKYLRPNTGLRPACLHREQSIHDQFDRMHFSAYGNYKSTPQKSYNQRVTISAGTSSDGECKDQGYKKVNLLCGNNSINLVPTVCDIDYGGPVVNVDFYGYIPYLFGVVSTLSRGCGEDLVGTRISSHVEWIESIVLDSTNERLIFT